MSRPGIKQTITVLHDNPPLTGKKHFLVSMISPESRQKHQVHALKIHDMCEDYEEAEQLATYYNSLDPVFDVLIGTVGKWSPWVFNFDDITPKYADDQLNTLVKSHRTKAKAQDQEWINHVNKHRQDVSDMTSKEFQKARAETKKETAVQMLFRIRQIELTIKRRQDELTSLNELYQELYDDSERTHASSLENDFPLAEPAIMDYRRLPSENDSGPSESTVTPSSSSVVPKSIEDTKGKGPVRQRTLEEIKNEILAKRRG